MGANLLKLELIWGAVGQRLMMRSVFFAMLLGVMPTLYIIQDAGSCDLTEDFKPLFGPGIRQIESPMKHDVEFYSDMYGDLISHGLLRPGLKGLCMGAGAGNSALALRSKGLPGAIVDRHCDLRRFHFADASFDFVYSGWSLDRARAPALLALEIERTLKPGGVAIVVVSPRRLGQDSNPIHSLSPIAALFRNAGVAYVTSAGNSSVITLRKRASGLEFANPCGKYNRSVLKLAEPQIQNHTSAVYLSDLIDISVRNRHVYVEVGSNETFNSVKTWFLGTYPKQNKTFHVHIVDLDNRVHNAFADLSTVSVVPAAAMKRGRGQGFELGVWTRENIRNEDFVVVKVGCEHIRGMIESGAMCLIDEIFVVCNQSYLDADCMHLLRSLRNIGVFAHKW